VLDFGLVLNSFEFGESLDMCEQRDDLFVHLLVGKAQVDDVLDEGQEHEAGVQAVGLDEVVEQSEADLVGEDGQVLVLKDLASLDALLPEGHVFLVDRGGDLLQLLSESGVLIHHLKYYYQVASQDNAQITSYSSNRSRTSSHATV
jgi:hypothetical protein